MSLIGRVLEFLSRYGLIDIFFGIGIVTYFQRKLRRRVTKAIDGVEIMPRIVARDGFIEIKVQNNSKDPLYLYRASFKPGYYSDKVDMSSMTAVIKSSIFAHWRNDILPRVTEGTRTLRGDFVLQAQDPQGEAADSLFLEPKQIGSYTLGVQESTQDEQVWDQLLDRRHCGELQIHFVHGEMGGVLRTQI
jgi:hypothetical protein